MKYIYILILAAFLSSAYLVFYFSLIKKEYRANVSRYNISEIEIKRLIELEKSGDSEAAYRLSLYYDLIKLDSGKSLVYLRRAVELGHQKARNDFKKMQSHQSELHTLTIAPAVPSTTSPQK